MLFQLLRNLSVTFPEPVEDNFPNLRNINFFFGLGAQKSGSTWLAKYLDLHPQVSMSAIKELHVWNQYIPFKPDYKSSRRARARFERLSMKFLNSPIIEKNDLPRAKVDGLWNDTSRLEALKERINMGHNPSHYLKYFSALIRPESLVCGEITPEYALLSSDLLYKVRNFLSPHFKSVKPVFIMRDPVDRLWSNMKHDHRRGRGGPASETWRKRIKSREALDRSRYDFTCLNLEKAFPKEDILYLFYENLFTETTLQNLCAFFNISYHAVDEKFFKEEIKKGIADTVPDEFIEVAREKLDDVYIFIKQHFGSRAPESWRW